MRPDEAARFWDHALERNAAHADLIERRLVPAAWQPDRDYDVGISYARESLVEAQQIAQECTNHGLRAFFNETVMSGLGGSQRAWMERHLDTVYRGETAINLALWSETYAREGPAGHWTRLELTAMRAAKAKRRTPLLLVVGLPRSGGNEPGGGRRLRWDEQGAFGVVREVVRELSARSPD